MKQILIYLTATVALTSTLLGQLPLELKSVGADMLAALTGDTERFERGMRTLEMALAKNPQSPELKVLHGTGVFARSGTAFEKGDTANALQLWQSAMKEMAEAVELAPENLLVRGRRGVILISASRSTPAPMAAPLIELAVGDFEKIIEIRERDKTFAQNSEHKRGELLTSLGDGWNRLGNAEKARGYFERIAREMNGTVYGERAKAWLENKPETKAASYFACAGCHVE